MLMQMSDQLPAALIHNKIEQPQLVDDERDQGVVLSDAVRVIAK